MLSSWEAIEHSGPYKFDEDYIDYFTELVKRAGDYDFHVFINFHQDVWSRVSGGDGHPLWLFDKVGLDYTKFDEADAAINMQYLWDPDPKKNRYKVMVWGDNRKLFPASTMWTLFWAGKDFTPKLMVEDEITGDNINIQDYLQNHFITCVEKIANNLKDMEHVFGFNPLNEPSLGCIGQSVSKRVLKLEKKEDGQYNEPIPGIAWSPLDTMAAAAGFSRDIEKIGIGIKGLQVKKVMNVNPKNVRIWKDGAEDFWEFHGVWKIENDEPVALKDDYFSLVNGRRVDFTADYLVPFHKRISYMIRKYNRDWLVLIENDPEINGPLRYSPWPEDMPERAVNAFHWYDIIQLALKRFFWPITLDLVKLRPVWGMKGIQKMYVRQMKPHIELSKPVNDGEFPLLVGEFGIAMDMKKGKAYRKWKKKGNKAFKLHEKILNLMYNALDKLLLSGTLWNYASYNTNKWGDNWNEEDLSIYSRDQQTEAFNENIYSGARGLGGFCRPYAKKIAGMPIKMKFKRKTGEFKLVYQPDRNVENQTEIFVPNYQYPNGFILDVTGAKTEENAEEQRIYVHSPWENEVIVKILRKK